MVNEKRLLNKANSYFVNKEFDKALFLYSQLNSLYPTNQEYPLYAIFCDIASEDSQKAMSLYDYFTVMKKEESTDSAISYVKDVINAYDGDIEKMMDLLKELTDSTIDSLDAIEYKDFMRLVESRGSFRIAFEDIMFSTKVAIEDREDFFDFIYKLIENDFVKTAYDYLENFNEFFSYDNRIEEFYNLLKEKDLDNKSQ